jgi:predicted metal-dependent hydrolase
MKTIARPGARSSPSVRLLRVEGIPAPVEVRRHPTARRLTLRVSRTRRAVILTMPRSSDFREADQFLSRSLDWVRERLEGVPEPAPFRDGTVFPLRGLPHEVVFAGRSRGRAVVSLEPAVGGHLPRLRVSGSPEHAPRRLRDWLNGEASKDLDARVTVHACNLRVRARRITLRDQKSRWGSCSSAGQLSFSWRLVLAPPFVLDYVAAHEVAHLVEMNHGPRFWRLVAKTLPAFEEAKVWLRIHGMDLYRYGMER